MTLPHMPEVVDGLLLSRRGDVHRRSTTKTTSCAKEIPARHVPVSHVQAVVHKLPLCHNCFPGHRISGGSHVHR